MTSDASQEAPAIGLVSWRSPATGSALLDLAHRTGLPGVQLDLGGPGRGPWLDAPGNLEAMRDNAVRTGVALLAVAGNLLNDIGLTAPAGSADAAEVEQYLIRALDAATALGCPLVFVPSFRRSAIDGPVALRRTAAVLAWACAEAADRGLTLANENTLAPQDAATLIEAVGAPNFRLVLDTYNLPAAGVDPVGVIAATAQHLADQVHLKDGLELGGDVLLGHGDGHITSTLDQLWRQQVPVRWLMLENDYRDGDESRLRADIAWARERAADSHTQRIGAAHE